MKRHLENNQKSNQKKIAFVISWILNIALIFVFAYIIIIRIQTGQHVPIPLIVCILLIIVGLFRIGAAREKYQGSKEGQQQFNKIVIRSVILAPIIVAVFLTIVVLIKLKAG